MINFLLRLFVRDHQNIGDPQVRRRYGAFTGGAGIVLNVLLSVGKLAAGSLSGSIAVTADGLNNLSDVASSGVTLLSFRLAEKSADEEHPFGHGRSEYLAALVVSFLVLLMGFELGKGSVEKILHPAAVQWSLLGAVVMGISLAGKLGLGLLNRSLGKRIDSGAMRATAADSFSDMAATSAALLALVLARFTSLPADGWLGLVVSAFICCTGISLLRETIGPLLGEKPDPALVQDIERYILSCEHVEGMHDLILHNYGPGRIFGSVHAEVAADLDVMIGHEAIDRMEHDLLRLLGVQMVVHYDPLAVNDARLRILREKTEAALAELDGGLRLHDFRLVDGPTSCNLIFDLVVPHGYPQTHAQVRAAAEELIRATVPQANCVITVEESYV
ncbi:MAG: cation diffusion facilitator family transporter [Oscillospiraceae bacterium]|jgi:cation diffusion facilitator family transporter|nr:cation diffusion facilitator family transporter [Oscillospiraceae bacterium]